MRINEILNEADEPYLTNPERIDGAAYKYLPTGKIFGPYDTHADFIFQDSGEVLDPKINNTNDQFEAVMDMIDDGILVDGFITANGKFVNRKEAAIIVNLDSPDEFGLNSEDLIAHRSENTI
jgi:hypothetical protein